MRALQLGLDVAGLIVAGAATLAIQARVTTRQRPTTSTLEGPQVGGL